MENHLPEETRLFTSDEFAGEEIGEAVINPLIFIQSPLTVNIRYAPVGWHQNSDYVYIGRPGKGQDGYFGNPFPLKKGVEIEWMSEILGTTYEQELVSDILSLMASFSAKIYGKRSAENRRLKKLAEEAKAC